ncbi:MAG: hypothetical protein H6Q04_1397 [Acidobacteria bacterium]|nr:hypothetical protein [Acidobacteriota bacterium]
MGYIVWTPVQEKGSFLGEGDTGTFLNLIENGLRAIENVELVCKPGGDLKRLVRDPYLVPDLCRQLFLSGTKELYVEKI